MILGGWDRTCAANKSHEAEGKVENADDGGKAVWNEIYKQGL